MGAGIVDYRAEFAAKSMIRRGFLLCGVFLALSANAAAAGHADLRSVDLAAAPDRAGLTLDLSRTTAYRLFTLEQPSRVVIDLANTRLASGLHLPEGSGLVETVRAAPRPDGTLRIVLEVGQASTPTASWSSSTDHGARLVVRLGAAGEVATAAGSAPTLRTIRAAHAPADSDRDVIVAVDAGHGGHDPGATGHSGTHEKDVVLAIARALAARINDEDGMHAVLTRNRDEFLLLGDRVARARAAKADLFVSVHADSIANRDVTGSSVYVLSERGATDEAAKILAERENAADLMGGVSLGDKDSTLRSVLLDLSSKATISTSMTAAESVLIALEQVGEVRKPSVQQARFVVLKSPDIPSMLVETAYISNPVEERRLRTAREQTRLAEAIFTGLRGYFEHHPPAGTHFARAREPSTAAVLAGAGSRGPIASP